MKRSLRWDSPQMVRRSLSKIANEARAGELPAPVANSIVACANAILNSLRLDVQEKRIAEMEKKIAELEENNG